MGAGTGSGQGTFADNINDHGAITGNYVDVGNLSHGFVRAPNGTITTFDVPGAAQGTYPYVNNFWGTIAGWYVDTNGVNHGFLRQ
jgi:hypothetical protein